MADESSQNISMKKESSMYNKQPQGDEEIGETEVTGRLHRDLKNRHMQMIAIGGAIGAGLFVGTGSAFFNGGPGSIIICYCIVSVMILLTAHALAEMAVLYPINGAFYTYIVRFVDPAWGFAMGYQYALALLVNLPYELIAAGITIEFWTGSINTGIWVTVFLVLLVLIQVFGVRGYVEFILGSIKVIACIGFIILGIIIDTGAVGDQGYLGVKYWSEPGAFKNGFNGFCSVFVVAAFSFSGIEMVGLAAAESANPRKAIPTASKQVLWRITIFYILNLFILGLILRSDDDRLMGASGTNTKASPFVLAIEDAKIKILPSIFNAVITVSVLSVANSCTFGSTRTLQAISKHGMAPKFLEYVDAKGRPRWCIFIQLVFGLLAYIGISSERDTIFNWLLALTGLAFLMVWGSICWAHIRMRAGFKAQGISEKFIPYKAPFGIAGSYVGLGLNILSMVATFYNALIPLDGGSPNASNFFQSYLAFPIAMTCYVGWKIFTRDWRLLVSARKMDLRTDLVLLDQEEILGKTLYNLPRRILHALF